MLNKSASRLLLLLCSAGLLASCSVLDSAREQREAEEAIEREGRIKMVLADEALEPAIELADLTIELPEASPRPSWPQSGGAASKAVGHVSAAVNFEIDWRVSSGQGSDGRSALITPPVTSESAIFVIDSAQVLRAHSIIDGQLLWQKRLESGSGRDRVGIGSGIAYGDGKLAIASGFGFVAAYDAATGDLIWKTETEGPMTGSPTIKDGRVFVSSNNNEILAFSYADGRVLWSDQAISESARVLSSPSVAAIEEIVVVPFSSGEVISYLAANGRRLWTDALASAGNFTPISAINDIGARPVLGGGMVFAASQSGVMAGIEGRTGNRMWQQPLGATQAPALIGGYLFVVSVDAELVCIDAASGQIVWVRQLEQFKNSRKKQGRITYSGPLLASGKLVLASSRGDLLALDPQTGADLNRLSIGDDVYIEPIAAQGRIIILTDKGRLVAID